MSQIDRAIESYITERNDLLHRNVQELLSLLASKGKLASGDSALGIRDVCKEELEENTSYFIDLHIKEKRIYSKKESEDRIKASFIKYLNKRIIFLNEKRLQYLNQAFGQNVPNGMLRETDTQEIYNRIKNNSIIDLDEQLLNLRESKGKTIKARFMHELENNWLYLILILLLFVYGTYKTITNAG